MSTFLKVVGILLILSGIGLFLLSTSSAAEVGSQRVNNRYQAIGRDLGVGIGWTAVNCISLILFVSGVFTWWAGHSAGKSHTVTVTTNVNMDPEVREPEWEEPPIREREKREQATPPQPDSRPIVVQGAKHSVTRIIIGWSLFLYIVYAAIHFYSWADCDSNSMILTLFPIRQIYLIGAVEEKWPVHDDMARQLINALDASDNRDAIMHLIKHGDCILFSSVANEVAQQKDLVAQDEAQSASPVANLDPAATVQITSTGRLNIRSGPSEAHYKIIGKLSKGESAAAVGRNASGTWIKLGDAWVSAKFITTDDDLMSLPVVG